MISNELVREFKNIVTENDKITLEKEKDLFFIAENIITFYQLLTNINSKNKYYDKNK